MPLMSRTINGIDSNRIESDDILYREASIWGAAVTATHLLRSPAVVLREQQQPPLCTAIETDIAAAMAACLVLLAGGSAAFASCQHAPTLCRRTNWADTIGGPIGSLHALTIWCLFTLSNCMNVLQVAADARRPWKGPRSASCCYWNIVTSPSHKGCRVANGIGMLAICGLL